MFVFSHCDIDFPMVHIYRFTDDSTCVAMCVFRKHCPSVQFGPGNLMPFAIWLIHHIITGLA
jgi:hypothetical protein